MADSPIRTKSFNFALRIIQLSNKLRQRHEYVISDQLFRVIKFFTNVHPCEPRLVDQA